LLQWLFRSPREIKDPDLGTLTFDNRFWSGQATADGPLIVLHAGRRGPDDALRQTARKAVTQFAALEEQARRYLTSTASKDKPWPALSLIAVEILRPAAEWVRQEIAPDNPGAADAILRGAPTISLQFQITGDRNVVDVILLNGVPIGWDYH
jgi:hypothetical protein